MDAVRPHRLGVRGVVAHREQAAVHRRMQRLDPAVHHLREAGQLGHVDDGEPRIRQRLARAAGRDDFDAVTDQLAGEFGDAGLVGHAR